MGAHMAFAETRIRRPNGPVWRVALVVCLVAGALTLIGSTTVPPMATWTIAPLEGRVRFFFAERPDGLALLMQTESIYPSLSSIIEVRLARSSRRSLHAVVVGVRTPSVTALRVAADGPARGELLIGDVQGEFTLNWSYGGQQDAYHMVVTPTEIVLTPEGAPSFTMPEVTTRWARLPRDAVWVLVYDPVAYVVGENVWRPMAWEVYDAETRAFFADLEALGAQPFVPPEGVYTSTGFVAPWPERWIRQEADTIILRVHPQDGFWPVRWPQVRYYIHPDWTAVARLIEAYETRSVMVVGHSATGEYASSKR